MRLKTVINQVFPHLIGISQYKGDIILGYLKDKRLSHTTISPKKYNRAIKKISNYPMLRLTNRTTCYLKDV